MRSEELKEQGSKVMSSGNHLKQQVQARSAHPHVHEEQFCDLRVAVSAKTKAFALWEKAKGSHRPTEHSHRTPPPDGDAVSAVGVADLDHARASSHESRSSSTSVGERRVGRDRETRQKSFSCLVSRN